ncbi:hypothetical protein [Micromonospora chalcea]|uniref:hypothetical protein n=1 Tax=Micromonospora chalcea TaxID=1874 RepID=UPI003CF9240B
MAKIYADIDTTGIGRAVQALSESPALSKIYADIDTTGIGRAVQALSESPALSKIYADIDTTGIGRAVQALSESPALSKIYADTETNLAQLAARTSQPMTAQVVSSMSAVLMQTDWTEVALLGRPGDGDASNASREPTLAGAGQLWTPPESGLVDAGPGLGKVWAEYAADVRLWLVQPRVKAVGIPAAIYLFGAWYLSFKMQHPEVAEELKDLLFGIFFLLISGWWSSRGGRG